MNSLFKNGRVSQFASARGGRAPISQPLGFVLGRRAVYKASALDHAASSDVEARIDSFG